MKSALLTAGIIMILSFSPNLEADEFRLGAHGNFLNPKDSDFDEVLGYGALFKYKFTDTLGIEIGADYFRWEVDELIEWRFSQEIPNTFFKEVDRVYPIYFTALIFSPYLEQDARAYLGLGGGYYEIEADIEGNDPIFTITGKVKGQWSAHAAVGADFQLSPHILLNVDLRYVFVDADRELTFYSSRYGSFTTKEEVEFDNWQLRLGLEYLF